MIVTLIIGDVSECLGVCYGGTTQDKKLKKRTKKLCGVTQHHHAFLGSALIRFQKHKLPKTLF